MFRQFCLRRLSDFFLIPRQRCRLIGDCVSSDMRSLTVLLFFDHNLPALTSFLPLYSHTSIRSNVLGLTHRRRLKEIGDGISRLRRLQ